MLKKTALAGLGLVLLVSPSLAAADTLSDLRAQLQQLLIQIRMLQQNANQTQGTLGGVFGTTPVPNSAMSAAVTSSLVAAPTASLTANGSKTIAPYDGSTINYAWSSTNATSWTGTYSAGPATQCTGPNSVTNSPWIGFGDSANGSKSATVGQLQAGCNYVYTYTVSGPGGTASDRVSVYVPTTAVKLSAINALSPTQLSQLFIKPTLTFKASPSTITAGQSSILSWGSGSTSECWFSNFSNPSYLRGLKIGLSGAVSTGALYGTTSYEMTCKAPPDLAIQLGAGADLVKMIVTVTVGDHAAPIANLTANGYRNITANVGSNIIFDWSSTYGTSWTGTYSAESTQCTGTNSATNNPLTGVGNNARGFKFATVQIPWKAGCNYVVTYTVSGPDGTASDSVSIKVAGI